MKSTPTLEFFYSFHSITSLPPLFHTSYYLCAYVDTSIVLFLIKTIKFLTQGILYLFWLLDLQEFMQGSAKSIWMLCLCHWA
jgi:hypothetical protein